MESSTITTLQSHQLSQKEFTRRNSSTYLDETLYIVSKNTNGGHEIGKGIHYLSEIGGSIFVNNPGRYLELPNIMEQKGFVFSYIIRQKESNPHMFQNPQEHFSDVSRFIKIGIVDESDRAKGDLLLWFENAPVLRSLKGLVSKIF